MSLFEEKVVIVTGAASGIGRATALAFAQEGAKVLVADIDLERAQETAALIGDNAVATRVDVADMDSCQAMVDQAVAKFGRLDVIVNNAGIGGDRFKTADQPLENWQRVIDVNLNGVFHGCKASIPHMKNNGGGVIVNTASVDGLIAMGTVGPYVAAKHAVIGLTKTVALEYGCDNIRCVAVAPGFIETNMTAEGLDDGEKAMLASVVPLGQRAAAPSEVAELILWLTSSKASYVTGSVHQVDAGLLAGFSMLDGA